MALDPSQIAANGVLTPYDIDARNQKLQSGQLENTSKQQSIDTTKIQQASDKLDYSLKTLAQVYDQPSFDAWHQNMQKNGIDTSGDPTTYDPAWQKQSLIHGVSMKDQMQIQAMGAYRNAQIQLGYDRVNKGTGGWNPVTQSWDNDLSGPAAQPAPGGQGIVPQPDLGNQPLPSSATMNAPAAAIPANPPPLPTNGSAPAGTGGQLPAGPVLASQQAIADQQAKTGVSPAQRPDLASLPAAQVANMPVSGAAPAPAPVSSMPAGQAAAMSSSGMPDTAQRMGETTQQYRMRLQSQGIGSTSPVIYAANRIMQDAKAAGKPIPYETAFAIAKKGLGTGQALDVNTGQVANISGATQATADMAQAKDEGATYGKELGAQMDQYRTAAQAAQGMDATLNAMKADSEKFRMGAMADMQGTAKSYVQAIAQSLGVPTPEMDFSLGAQQAFTKSAMGLVMGGMQKVQGRAFGEMRAIQSAFPTQAMSKDGFDLVTSQIAGTNQYSEALYQAANDYKQKNGTLSGFENSFQKNVSPWAYVVKNMTPAQLSDLSKSLSSTPEGQKELHMIADQIDFATKAGYMQ